MSLSRKSFAKLDFVARKLAFFPLGEGDFLAVEMSEGCEKFVGRYARLPEFRFDQGIVHFRRCDT